MKRCSVALKYSLGSYEEKYIFLHGGEGVTFV